MPEDIIQKTIPYTFKGYFNPKELVKFIKSNVEELGYRLNETEFEEETKEKGKDIKLRYECEKPLTDYYLSRIRIFIEASGDKIKLKDNEKTIITYQGTCKFLIQGVLVQDFLNKIEKTSLGKFLSQVYSKYIGTEEREDMEGKVKEDVKELVARIKQYLNSDF